MEFVILCFILFLILGISTMMGILFALFMKTHLQWHFWPSLAHLFITIHLYFITIHIYKLVFNNSRPTAKNYPIKGWISTLKPNLAKHVYWNQRKFVWIKLKNISIINATVLIVPIKNFEYLSKRPPGCFFSPKIFLVA